VPSRWHFFCTLRICLFCLPRLVGQVVTEVRRLVVTHVLPHDGEAIDVVLHQRRNAIIGGDVCSENVDARTIRRVEKDEFLAPIAQQIGLQTRGGFRAVASGGVVETRDGSRSRTVPLHDGRRATVAAKQFLLQIAVPIDTETVWNTHLRMLLP